MALQQAKNAVIKMSRRAAAMWMLAAPLLLALKMDEETVSADVGANLIDRMEWNHQLPDQADRPRAGRRRKPRGDRAAEFCPGSSASATNREHHGKEAEELYDKEASFSESAKELQLLDAALERILVLTDEAFENDDVQKAAQIAGRWRKSLT